MSASSFLKAVVGYVSSPLETIKRLDAITKRFDYLDDRIDGIVTRQRADTTRDIDMSVAIDKIKAEVSENKDLVASTKALVSSLAQQIRDAKGDEDALEALAADLDAQNSELAKAVTDNTPFTPSGQ